VLSRPAEQDRPATGIGGLWQISRTTRNRILLLDLLERAASKARDPIAACADDRAGFWSAWLARDRAWAPPGRDGWALGVVRSVLVAVRERLAARPAARPAERPDDAAELARVVERYRALMAEAGDPWAWGVELPGGTMAGRLALLEQRIGALDGWLAAEPAAREHARKTL